MLIEPETSITNDPFRNFDQEDLGPYYRKRWPLLPSLFLSLALVSTAPACAPNSQEPEFSYVYVEEKGKQAETSKRIIEQAMPEILDTFVTVKKKQIWTEEKTITQQTETEQHCPCFELDDLTIEIHPEAEVTITESKIEQTTVTGPQTIFGARKGKEPFKGLKYLEITTTTGVHYLVVPKIDTCQLNKETQILVAHLQDFAFIALGEKEATPITDPQAISNILNSQVQTASVKNFPHTESDWRSYDTTTTLQANLEHPLGVWRSAERSKDDNRPDRHILKGYSPSNPEQPWQFNQKTGQFEMPLQQQQKVDLQTEEITTIQKTLKDPDLLEEERERANQRISQWFNLPSAEWITATNAPQIHENNGSIIQPIGLSEVQIGEYRYLIEKVDGIDHQLTVSHQSDGEDQTQEIFSFRIGDDKEEISEDSKLVMLMQQDPDQTSPEIVDCTQGENLTEILNSDGWQTIGTFEIPQGADTLATANIFQHVLPGIINIHAQNRPVSVRINARTRTGQEITYTAVRREQTTTESKSEITTEKETDAIVILFIGEIHSKQRNENDQTITTETTTTEKTTMNQLIKTVTWGSVDILY